MRADSTSPAHSAAHGLRARGRLEVKFLGVVSYEDGLKLQEEAIAARRRGTSPDTLFLLEHPPVVTIGRTAAPASILTSQEELAQVGIELFRVDRGGDVTFHGPGQLVGYPIFDLRDRGKDAHAFLRGIEAVLIRTLAAFDIEAHRVGGLTGVWTSQGKIAAIGIGVKRWIAKHGFALNVNTDLSHFQRIVPCGLTGKKVVSMERVLGGAVEFADVARVVGDEFEKEFFPLR